MKTLELFSGTKSFSKVMAKHGHQTFTIDNNPKLNPDLIEWIEDLKIEQLPYKPDVLWASPPCQAFSVAAISKNWNKDGTPKNDRAVLAQELVLSTLELIRELKPKYWFIENPRGMLRKFPIMEALPIRNTVTYCQYSDDRMKPTDIWTNNPYWTPRPMCKNGDGCHIAAPRGSKTGTQGLKDAEIRSIIPHELCLEVMSQVKF